MIFTVSTVGFDNIIVNWDQRQSNSSSRFSAFQYSLDGINFVTLTNPALITIGLDPVPGITGSVTAGGLLTRTGGDRWLNGNTVDLSSIAGAANNTQFAFRIVASFDPAGPSFVRTDTGVGPIASTPSNWVIGVQNGLHSRRVRRGSYSGGISIWPTMSRANRSMISCWAVDSD